MRRVLALAALSLAAACAAPSPAPSVPAAPAVRTRVIETAPLRIDRIYHSMDGPDDRLNFDPADLEWVTGFKTEVVDAESGVPLGGEFFCHSQIQLLNTTRLIVTATGIDDLRFPDGYAMPLRQIVSDVPETWRGISFLGMVLNNHDPAMNRLTRVRATLDYLTAADVAATGRTMKPLYKVELPMTVENVVHEESSAGEHCVVAPGLKAHWMVPPGGQTTRRTFTDLFPIDATVHVAAVHLHNHGVQMRLLDATTGAELWRTEVVYEPERRQIARIPYYSDARGFQVFASHAYEIEARYENLASVPVDAMAVMYLFYNPAVPARISYPQPPPPGATDDLRG